MLKSCVLSAETTVQLHPWRDGVAQCQNSIEQRRETIKSVDIRFMGKDFIEGISVKMDLDPLFESIEKLPHLESLSVQMDSCDLQLPVSMGIPPLSTITTILCMDDSKLATLTLAGLRLFADDFDMNGFVEAVRISSSLRRITVRDCAFASTKQLEHCHSSLSQRTSMKTCSFVNNRVVELSQIDEDVPLTPWYQTILSYICIFPFPGGN